MAFVTYTHGERHFRGGWGHTFAHILGKESGFSKAYHFGRTDSDMRPADITYTQEMDGDDLENMRELLDAGGLEKSQFAIADEAPPAVARRQRRAAEAAAPAPADPSEVSATGGAPGTATAAPRRP